MKNFPVRITVFCFAILGAVLVYFLTHSAHHAILCIGVAAIDSTRARAALERISDTAGKIMTCFPGRAQEIIVNRDYICTEQVIANNVSTYIFDIWDKTLQNQSPKRPLVKGVKDNDLFLAISNRVLIDSRTIGNSNVQVETWPDPVTFFKSGCTVNDLWSVYAAKWSLQVDRIIYIPGDFTRKFLLTPAFNFNEYAFPFTTVPPTPSIMNVTPGSLDGKRYWEMDPYPILSGRLDNTLKIDISLYAGWNGAANTSLYATLENVITFEFDGYTVKNGAGFIPFFNGTLDINNSTDVQNYNVGANI